MSEVAQLEAQRVDMQEIVARRDLALKVVANPDFKKLIFDEYCTKDCARFAQNSGDYNLNAEQRQDSINMAQAAGHLRRWLTTIIQIGNNAAREIDDIDETLVVARQEAGE